MAIEPIRFRCSPGKGRGVTLRQFPVVLAYAITDYKCQGQTYITALVDLKRPTNGSPSATSGYVQLSRVQALLNLSIIRPFDANELMTPLADTLLQELEWQRTKYEETLSRNAHMIR